jgi:N-dimethylarginine dimethylaminohydrolase
MGLQVLVMNTITSKLEKGKPPHPVRASYLEELKLLWDEEWGAQSEVGKLRVAMVHKHGDEFRPDIIEDLAWYGVSEFPDYQKAVQQHDHFVDVLKQEGVKVHYLNPPSPAHGPYSPANPRIWATRDPGVVITGGAIIGRMALPWRKKDEVFWSRRVMQLGCPILRTVTGHGTFEGGNVVWLDPEHVCIGQSIRTNSEGISQVSAIMQEVGGVKEVRVVPIPGYLENIEWPAGGYAHLDVVFGMADVNLGVIYPPGVPFDFIEYLKYEKKIQLIEAQPEEVRNEGCNIVALAPRKIIMNEKNINLRKGLEKEGVDVIPVDFSEICKFGGAGHCATGPLLRDRGPMIA